ncbi:MAG: hypothetical protein ACI4Q3_03375 [Kiritimatiellia bacterium]
MALIEYEMPDSWNAKGMDWNTPDPRCADYVMAIRQALMERAAAAHVSLSRDVVCISPWKTVSLKAVEAVIREISYLAPNFFNDKFSEYKEDWSDFPKMWTYRDLILEDGCELYRFAHYGQLLENGGDWLRTIRNALDKLHIVRCSEARGTTYSRSGSKHDPPFDESIGTAMSLAFGEGMPSESKFTRMPSEFYAWSGNTHWKCPQPLEEGQEDWEGNVDGYCGYAQSRAHRVRKVRSWLAGRELDFRTYSLVANPTGPVPYSQELATSVFDTGDTGLDEGMNEESTHIEDPLDMDVTIGDIDTIPKNEVVPTSDFDDKGSAIHRRSAKRGYTAKLWAFLDYNCENGFKFKEDD